MNRSGKRPHGLVVVSAAMLPGHVNVHAGALSLHAAPVGARSSRRKRTASSSGAARSTLSPVSVMIALALPFAYLHGRSGGISYKVFGGIALGISFILLNNVAGHLGLLKELDALGRGRSAELALSGPSMAAFTWLVRYR